MHGWKKTRVLFVAFVLGATSAVAFAGAANGAMRISLTVSSACNVRTQAITSTVVPGAIDISCTKDTPVAVYLDGAPVAAAPNGQRTPYKLLASGRVGPGGQAMPVAGQAQAIHLNISALPSTRKLAAGNEQGEEVVHVIY